MNSWSLSLLIALISCFALGVYSKDCVEDDECHYGRCCEGHCVWHRYCPCVNDNDCRAGEKCNNFHGFRYCKMKTDTPVPTTSTLKTYSTKSWQDLEAVATSKTKVWLKKAETHRRELHPWRTGSTVILISCAVAVILLLPFIYFVFKKSRKRPTNVTVLPRHATQAGMTMMNPSATADARMQQGSAACNGATAMDSGEGSCPFKAPGALPSYYELELEGEVKGKDDPPPGYDEAVKPASAVTTK